MKYEKYESILISQDFFEFTFVSDGPKGQIQKIVQFKETDNPEIYNLAFGNLLPDGAVDDHVKNDNLDRDKILATVAATVYEFTSHLADKFVFFRGNTPSRTRLYRMTLTLHFNELSRDFEIFGITLISGFYEMEQFVKGNDFEAFLIKRKID